MVTASADFQPEHRIRLIRRLHDSEIFDITSAMKYSFLRTNVSLAVIGIVLGLACGFKLANWQYRRQQGLSLQASVAQATSRTAQEGGQNLSPEQREQMLNQAKAVIDRAKSNPNDVEAQLEAASQFIEIERPDEAIQFLEQAQKADPKDARTQHGFAVVYSMKGQLPESVNAAKRSLELRPGNPSVQMLLAVTYIQAKTNLDEAEKLISGLESAGSVNPEILASARKDLNAARSGGSAPGNKTVLNHGPEEPKPPQSK